MPPDRSERERRRTIFRERLIELGVPESGVDELLDLAAEYGRAAGRAAQTDEDPTDFYQDPPDYGSDAKSEADR